MKASRPSQLFSPSGALRGIATDAIHAARTKVGKALAAAKRKLSEREERRQTQIRVRRVSRRVTREEYLEELATGNGTEGKGFCCPRCHTWRATAEARNECRRLHRIAEEARRERKEGKAA